jgi:hypothetical protein
VGSEFDEDGANVSPDRCLSGAKTGCDDLRGKPVGHESEHLMLSRSQGLGHRRRLRVRREHEVHQEPTLTIVDRDRRDIDLALVSSRLDVQDLA